MIVGGIIALTGVSFGAGIMAKSNKAEEERKDKH
jgi:hypothetical protein